MADQDTALLNTMPLPAGKVPPQILRQLLAVCEPDPDLVVPPAVGEDGAVVRLPGGLVSVASDPITFPTPRPGHFAVCVNANDIAVMGARPRFFTLTVVMPVGATGEQLGEIMRDAVNTGRALGATLIGGHTEMSRAVNIPLLSVTMFGAVIGATAVRTGGARTGDVLIQVSPAGIEGTAILASEYREQLVTKLGVELVERAQALIESPGISVVGPACLAAEKGFASAMHDPTEGGILTGVREMAEASGRGVVVAEERIIFLDETRRITDALGCDRHGLISSGSLLLAVSPANAARALQELKAGGWPGSEIGHFTEGPGCWLSRGDARGPMPEFVVDELAANVANA